MICSNSAASASAPSTLTVSWKACPAGVGGMPTCPAVTLAFCFWTALITSAGVRERWRISSASSQMRMLYWPMPNTMTSPTPGRRANLSRSARVAKLLRNRLSCALFVEVSVMICRMAVDFFLVTTPCCWTGTGNCDIAAATRFCTSTCAKSRSVPTSKVTVSV